MTEDQRRFVSRTRSDLEAGADVTIVAYGDSITAGFAVRRGFPSFWKEMLDEKYPEAGLEMINSGISGDTTLDGISRLDWAALSYEPDLVTINFGINDCVLGLGLEEREVGAEVVDRLIHGRDVSCRAGLHHAAFHHKQGISKALRKVFLHKYFLGFSKCDKTMIQQQDQVET